MSMWPFREGPINLRDLQNEFDRMVDRLYHGGINTAPLDGQDWAPPIDLFDESDRYVVTAEVPGMSPDDMNVAVVERTVTITGVKAPAATGGADRRSLRNERRFGKFRRTVELPEAVDDLRVQASFAHGVLTVSLPKQEVRQGRKVPIDSAE